MTKKISENSTGLSTLGRREFLVTTLVSGFALAVQPIQAQTAIKTDAAGLTAGEVKIPVKDGAIPAYRAMPDKKGKKFPVVLVVHEIFGVHEWIQDVCRRFAKLGYMAIAPALYAREGKIESVATVEGLVRNIFSKIPDTQSMSDLDSTVEWAKASGSGNTKKLSITGFCWGGRIVWLYAAHNSNVKAAAAWYGRLVNPPNSPKNELQPTMPIEYAKDLKVPVIGFYGGLDKGISQESIGQMREELKKGRSGSEINVYPQADHGFHADYRPTYNKEASDDAWAKLQEWFKKNGAI
jgi:carboxymethylenebutenolidase